MSLTGIRQFIRTNMDDLGFQEWTDAFNTDNIPNDILDKSYHILSTTVDESTVNMHDLPLEFEQQISVFRKGFRDPAQAVDTIIEDCENIICELMHPDNRFDGHVNTIFRGFTIAPLNAENDNCVKAILTFNVRVILGVT